MPWLPEYGVGIIAFGNLTYTGWGRVTTTALERAGEDRRSAAAAAGAVARADRRARRGVAADRALGRSRWPTASPRRTCSSIESKDRRRAEIERLRETVGACTPGTGFDVVENALRGRWTMSCERGKLEVAITLAPTMPPKVQLLGVRVRASIATQRVPEALSG